MYVEDTFAACFGATIAGSGEDRLPAIVRNAVRNGYAVVLNKPGTKQPLCPLAARTAKQQDRAAQEEAAAAGHPNANKVRHPCGLKHAFGTDQAEAAHRATKRLVDQRGPVNVGIELAASRLLVVDVDTREQNEAFLAEWAAHCDEPVPNGYTVTSPGERQVNADGIEHWLHSGGGHYYFTLPEDVELPEGDGSMTAAGGWVALWRDRQVLVPPSARVEGAYRLTGVPRPLPEWLLDRIRAHVAERDTRRQREYVAITDAGDPIEVWSAEQDWAPLLVEDGWIDTGLTDTCTCPIFTAPGEHASPKSATGHELGCTRLDIAGSGPLHLWTDNPPAFLATAGKTVSKLQYVAHRDHDGHVGAAMTELGIERRGSREATDATLLDEDDEDDRSADDTAVGLSDDEEAAFWSARPVLVAIREHHRVHGGNPWALLGAVLGFAVAHVGPHVKLPPVSPFRRGVGGHGSLNLQLGLVGGSGAGKDNLVGDARALLDVTPALTIPEYNIGTGQGITASYMRDGGRGKPMVQVCDTVLFVVSEISDTSAHADMTGSTLLSELRKWWTGARLATAYADPKKRRYLDAHSYRGAALANVQPEESGVLFNDIAAGTPQRWLWLPATPRPGTEVSLDEFAAYADDGTGLCYPWSPDDELLVRGESMAMDEASVAPGEILLDVATEIRVELFNRRRTGYVPENPLDAHRGLNKLKVAAGMALLDHRRNVSLDDWALAESVLTVSDATRARCQARLRRRSRQRNRARAVDEAERAEVIEAQREARLLDSAKARVAELLTQAGDAGVTRSRLRERLTTAQREQLEPALETLVTTGRIQTDEVTRHGHVATRYRAVS